MTKAPEKNLFIEWARYECQEQKRGLTSASASVLERLAERFPESL
jgi:hypothetical protein